MDKNEAKEIRVQLEKQHARKSGIFGRVKRPVKNYMEYQKRETYMRVGVMPIVYSKWSRNTQGKEKNKTIASLPEIGVYAGMI